MNYKDISIEEVERINKELQCDVICNADKQEIIFENILEEFINSFKDTLINAVNKIMESVNEVVKTIIEYVTKIFNKRISKKKFIKLLQSKGLERNNINKIIKNNRDKYTIWRYFISIPPNF